MQSKQVELSRGRKRKEIFLRASLSRRIRVSSSSYILAVHKRSCVSVMDKRLTETIRHPSPPIPSNAHIKSLSFLYDGRRITTTGRDITRRNCIILSTSDITPSNHGREYSGHERCWYATIIPQWQ